MLKRKANKKKISRRRKNPEDYNLIYSDKLIQKMTPKQVVTHIEVVSEYPHKIDYNSEIDDPLIHMDAEEILEYVNSFINRWRYLQD